MNKTFEIVKSEDKVKANGEWTTAQKAYGTPWKESVVTRIKAKNRREAWKMYQNIISKTYHVDNRALVARREDHDKKRRVELLSVRPQAK